MGFLFLFWKEYIALGLKSHSLKRARVFLQPSFPHSLSPLSQSHSLSPLSQQRSNLIFTISFSQSHSLIHQKPVIHHNDIRISNLLSHNIETKSPKIIETKSCDEIRTSKRESKAYFRWAFAVWWSCEERERARRNTFVRRHYFGLCSSPPTSLVVAFVSVLISTSDL